MAADVGVFHNTASNHGDGAPGPTMPHSDEQAGPFAFDPIRFPPFPDDVGPSIRLVGMNRFAVIDGNVYEGSSQYEQGFYRAFDELSRPEWVTWWQLSAENDCWVSQLAAAATEIRIRRGQNHVTVRFSRVVASDGVLLPLDATDAFADANQIVEAIRVRFKLPEPPGQLVDR